MELKWIVSHDGLLYSTDDGELHVGQFAAWKNGFFVRRAPGTSEPAAFVTELDPKLDTQEIKIIPGQRWFHVFRVPDDPGVDPKLVGRDVRVLTTANGFAMSKLMAPQKIVDQAELLAAVATEGVK